MIQYLSALATDVSWRIKFYFCEKIADVRFKAFLLQKMP